MIRKLNFFNWKSFKSPIKFVQGEYLVKTKDGSIHKVKREYAGNFDWDKLGINTLDITHIKVCRSIQYTKKKLSWRVKRYNFNGKEIVNKGHYTTRHCGKKNGLMDKTSKTQNYTKEERLVIFKRHQKDSSYRQNVRYLMEENVRHKKNKYQNTKRFLRQVSADDLNLPNVYTAKEYILKYSNCGIMEDDDLLIRFTKEESCILGPPFPDNFGAVNVTIISQEEIDDKIASFCCKDFTCDSCKDSMRYMTLQEKIKYRKEELQHRIYIYGMDDSSYSAYFDSQEKLNECLNDLIHRAPLQFYMLEEYGFYFTN